MHFEQRFGHIYLASIMQLVYIVSYTLYSGNGIKNINYVLVMQKRLFKKKSDGFIGVMNIFPITHWIILSRNMKMFVDNCHGEITKLIH